MERQRGDTATDETFDGSVLVGDSPSLESDDGKANKAKPIARTPEPKQPATKGVCQPLVSLWISFTQALHHGILQFVLTLSLVSARNPLRCIGLISLLSMALLGIGLATNFQISVDDEKIFAPVDCLPRKHLEVIKQTIPSNIKPLLFVVHANGKNVMTHEAMRRLFEATMMVQQLEGYDQICPPKTTTTGGRGGQDKECVLLGPTRYWHNNVTYFEALTSGSDTNLINTVSRDNVPGGTKFPHSIFFGNLAREQTSFSGNQSVITFAQSISSMMEYPGQGNEEMELFEKRVIRAALQLRESWRLEEPEQPYRLDFYMTRSVPEELTRAVTSDLPLIPVVFGIMTVFSCLVFFRRDPVQSRLLLGIGSIITIVCSIMSGFGIAFIIGLPFTSMTQILPFVIFGVGLDDTYIITGAYFRTDPSKDTVERIRETMQEVGASISMTTITTVLAFILGCISSSVPVIQWVCLYAFITITIDFIYQCSFFIALVVLEEQRVKANRRSIFFCFRVQQKQPTDDVAELAASPKLPLADRFMDWYSRQLLRPVVKPIVLVAFTAFLGTCIYNATLLTQDFSPTDFLPTDSYALSFLDTIDLYTNRKLQVSTFFTNVDQSDPDVQRDMIKYIEDLAALPQIRHEPEICWVRDFQELLSGSNSNPAFEKYSSSLGNLTFSQQLDMLLAIPEVKAAYGNDIIRNEDGDIVVSKCNIAVNYVDLNQVKEQTRFLIEQRQVTAQQRVNSQGRDSFFFFDGIFLVWEFFDIAIDELISTTISGVIAVSAIAFILIPHRSAILFVLPLIMILYVDLLGILQMCGLTLNPLTYIILVMSIGLLVDYLMHVMLRYYESSEATRVEKVKDTLRTMGSSIIVGGLSTTLGVIPLAWSSSGIIQTVFTMFLAMVILGLSHGLILLPVVLSYIGPEVWIHNDFHPPEPRPLPPTPTPAPVWNMEIENIETIIEV